MLPYYITDCQNLNCCWSNSCDLHFLCMKFLYIYIKKNVLLLKVWVCSVSSQMKNKSWSKGFLEFNLWLKYITIVFWYLCSCVFIHCICMVVCLTTQWWWVWRCESVVSMLTPCSREPSFLIVHKVISEVW